METKVFEIVAEQLKNKIRNTKRYIKLGKN